MLVSNNFKRIYRSYFKPKIHVRCKLYLNKVSGFDGKAKSLQMFTSLMFKKSKGHCSGEWVVCQFEEDPKVNF